MASLVRGDGSAAIARRRAARRRKRGHFQNMAAPVASIMAFGRSKQTTPICQAGRTRGKTRPDRRLSRARIARATSATQYRSELRTGSAYGPPVWLLERGERSKARGRETKRAESAFTSSLMAGYRERERTGEKRCRGKGAEKKDATGILTVVRPGRPHRYRELALERFDLHLLLLPLSSLGLRSHLAEDRVFGRAESRTAALSRLLRGLPRRPGARLDINVVLRHRDLIVHAQRIRADDLLLRLQYDFLAARLRQRLQRYHRLPVLALDRRLHGLARYLDRYRLYLDLLDIRLNLHFGYYVRGRHINLRRRRHITVPKWLARG